MKILRDLSSLISRWPGLGKKSADRIVYSLLKQNPQNLKKMAHLLDTLHEVVKKCTQCMNYSEGDLCEICRDSTREKTLCIVESSQDLDLIEKTGQYKGYYHVLHGYISPLDNIGPQELALDVLENRVKQTDIQEIIFAINSSIEAETTIVYISQIFEKSDIKLTRLASGLPVGVSIENADSLTLIRSLQSRSKV